MYFRLNPECYYIPGDRCSAIYDLIEGDVHSLNPEETRLIENCENNKKVKVQPLLDELKHRCIGNFYEQEVYIDKLRLGSSVQDKQAGRPPFLEKVFLEINNTCGQSCWFCGSGKIQRSLGCMGCNIWPEEGTAIGIEKWKQIIDELADLKCYSVFFTGGDLTLNWDLTKELLNYCQAKFPQTFVILNIKSFSNTIAEDLKNKAFPLIQTDNFSDINNENLFLLVSDEKNVEPKKWGTLNTVLYDFISKDFSNLPHNSPLNSEKKIQKTDIFRFTHNRKKHPCLAHNLTISWKGDVLPCPLLRHHSIGSIKNQHLSEIFKEGKEKIEKFWTMSLDNIPKCKKCEFRYSCNDCRAVEEELTGDLYGKTLCRYDVSEGIWI